MGVVTRVLVVILLLLAAAGAYAATVVLQWDAVVATDLAGYKVYQKVGDSSPFTQIQAIQKGTQTATITALDAAKTYSFAVTAYSTIGQESAYSNVVTVASYPVPNIKRIK